MNLAELRCLVVAVIPFEARCVLWLHRSLRFEGGPSALLIPEHHLHLRFRNWWSGAFDLRIHVFHLCHAALAKCGGRCRAPRLVLKVLREISGLTLREGVLSLAPIYFNYKLIINAALLH